MLPYKLVHMHISALPPRSQDYLKTIWDICELAGGAASLSAIAERTGQKNSTASEAMKRLAERGLVNHERYRGVTLTAEGEELAVAMVRRHRLVEMFLCETLGYGWDEVHDEAEELEHAVSDRLLGRIDAHLGHPRRDPHGDPIPDAEGHVDVVPMRTLAEVAVGERAVVERISDADPKLLRYLADHGVRPGSQVEVVAKPYSGVTEIRADEILSLAEPALSSIGVRLN